MTKQLSWEKFTGWSTEKETVSATSVRELRIILKGAWSIANSEVLVTKAHSATMQGGINIPTQTTQSTDLNNGAIASGFNDLPENELDGLIERIEQAMEHNLALSSDDYALRLNAVLTLASMQEKLSHNDLTIVELLVPPKLRRGRFAASDSLIASLMKQ